MKKPFLFLSIIIFIGVIIFLLSVNLFSGKKNNTNNTNPVTKNNTDIQVFSPNQNEIIDSPLKITGLVNGNGWNGFEGQVGTVRLLDSRGDELAKGILKATTEWTQLPTSFETDLDFKSPGGGAGFLVFHNENASGDQTKDKIFTLPIKFK